MAGAGYRNNISSDRKQFVLSMLRYKNSMFIWSKIHKK